MINYFEPSGGKRDREGKEEIGRGRRRKERKRGDIHNSPTNRPRLRERGRERKGIFDTPHCKK